MPQKVPQRTFFDSSGRFLAHPAPRRQKIIQRTPSPASPPSSPSLGLVLGAGLASSPLLVRFSSIGSPASKQPWRPPARARESRSFVSRRLVFLSSLVFLTSLPVCLLVLTFLFLARIVLVDFSFLIHFWWISFPRFLLLLFEE